MNQISRNYQKKKKPKQKTPKNPFTPQVIHRAKCWVGPCGDCLLDCRYLSSTLRNQVWWFSCLWYVHDQKGKEFAQPVPKQCLLAWILMLAIYSCIPMCLPTVLHCISSGAPSLSWWVSATSLLHTSLQVLWRHSSYRWNLGPIFSSVKV